MGFMKFLLNRPVSVLLIVFSIIAFGVMSIGDTRMEYFPDLDMPMEVVMATYPGADADSMERLVIEKIEDVGGSLGGIKTIESNSYENYGTVVFSYEYGTNMTTAYSELKAEIDNLQNDLPKGVDSIKIMEVNVNSAATISLAAKSVDGSNITEYVNNTVEPALKALSGVGDVDIKGGGDKFCKVVMDQSKMSQYGISLQQVATDIAQADFDIPVGTIEFGTQNIAANAYTDLDWHDIFDIAVHTNTGALVHLSDLVSTIYIAEDDPEAISRFNAQDVVLIDVDKKSSAATVAVCNAVAEEAKKLENESVEFEIVHADSDDIMDTLKEVLKTLMEGVGITMVVLLVFMGDLRASLIVSAAMPLSMFISFIVLKMIDVPFDLMSGTGLIIAIGMLIDNSIVVLESCFKMQEDGYDFKEAAAKGTTVMLFSVLGSTITTIVVYLPVALTKGMGGQMLRPLCYAIIFTMVASLVDSITVVPLLFMLFKPKAKTDLPINKVLAWAGNGYKKLMPPILRHPVLPVIVATVLLGVAIGFGAKLNFDFFPPAYDGSMKVKANFRSGTKLEAMDERIKQVENVLVEDKNFESVDMTIKSTGVEMTAHSAGDSKRSSEEAVAYYTRLFSDVTDMDILFTPTGVSSGLGSMMSSNNEKIILESADMDLLEDASILVEDKLRGLPGVIDVKNSATVRKTSAKFKIDQQAAREVGLQPSEIANWIYGLLNGIKATTVDVDDQDDIEVWVQYPDHEYNDPEVLLSQYINVSGYKWKPHDEILSIEYEELLQSIHRVDGKFQAEVETTLDSDIVYALKRDVNAAVKEVELPEGVIITKSVSSKNSDTEMAGLLVSLIIAVFLIFLVMGVQFESVKYSLMVMTCIPFSFIGSFTLMYVMNEPLSFMALMGILMLVGMVVNNGIMLVDATNENLAEGLVIGEALISSGMSRLRPILMTTLTTVLSMLPLLLNGNSGVSMMHGMAVIIVGGLVASTILAMFLMPPFYLIFSGKKRYIILRKISLQMSHRRM
ncbi:MAG: efflux RND transporter permease subunit [Lachnospiraceae bacterium]|nr:efflux RND transporter permease subunit [Lachnospiraceae bacterium]